MRAYSRPGCHDLDSEAVAGTTVVYLRDPCSTTVLVRVPILTE